VEGVASKKYCQRTSKKRKEEEKGEKNYDQEARKLDFTFEAVAGRRVPSCKARLLA